NRDSGSTRVRIITQPAPSVYSIIPTINPNLAALFQSQTTPRATLAGTATPQARILHSGEQMGRTNADGKQYWSYEGRIGQSVNISGLATHDFNLVWQDEQGNVLRAGPLKEPISLNLRSTGTYTLLVEGPADSLYILNFAVE
ncbi:MAG: hypothetical protein K8L99_05630, partial [Anaerolineae bacterium]|nr:hypothetical protein [Anaerolineae bacterium]